MYTNKDMLFNGCILSSIAHAIMTNIYPDLSYEQSWDGNNFSINNSSGVRGTVSFEGNICVCAIRDDNSRIQFHAKKIMKMLKNFPESERKLAINETLQYLLLDGRNGIEPCITSMFWIDTDRICYPKQVEKNLKRDISLLEHVLLPTESAIIKMKEYYDMDSDCVLLLNQLYRMKMDHPTESIGISKNMTKLFPGNGLNDECIESLAGLNFFVEQE